MIRLIEIRGISVGLAMLAEVLLVASAVLYMLIYGEVFNPGHPEDYYERHIEAAGPWISIVIGPPIFFLLGRWATRRRSVSTAAAFWVLWALLDTSILLAVAGLHGISQILVMWIAGLGTKALATWAGAVVYSRSANFSSGARIN